MLLRFFRSTGAQVLVLIPLIGFFLWLPALLGVPGVSFVFDYVQMPFYKFVTDLIPVQSFFATVLTFLLVIFQAYLLVRLNTKFIFINNRTYLPALLYILLTASIPDLQRLNPVIFASFFLLLALENIFDSYKKSNKLAHEVFLAGIYLSIGALFYSYTLLFILTLWVGLAVLKPFNWREWLFTLLGVALPVYFCFSYFYLLHDQPLRLWNDFMAVFSFKPIHLVYPVTVYIFIGLILILMALASQFIAKTYVAKKNLPRKAFNIFLWLFVNALAIFILVRNSTPGLIYLAAIPVSYLLSNYFALIKSEFWGNIFLLAIFLLLIVIQIIH